VVAVAVGQAMVALVVVQQEFKVVTAVEGGLKALVVRSQQII
jgi:hypothetical protein